MKWEYQLGLKMLMGRKRRFFFSPMAVIAICGIAFGMTATLVSLSVISGFQTAYEKAILGFNAHLILVREGDIPEPEILKSTLDSLKITEDDIEYWKKHFFLWDWFKHIGLFEDPRMESLSKKGVLGISPFVYREGLGILPHDVTGIVLKGIDPKSMETVYPIRYELFQDGSKGLESYLQSSDLKAPPVLLGKDLFKSFFPEGISENVRIRLIIPKGESAEKKTLTDYAQDFSVIGTFESGLFEFDSQFILTSLDVMQRLFHLGTAVSGFEMVLDDPNKAPVVAQELESVLPIAAEVVSWDQLNEALFSAMKMEKTLFLVIMLLIIVVASFNVMGIIFMMILNRQGDLAVLRAMGAWRSRLHRAFTLQGLCLGVVGALLGVLISLGCLWSLTRFEWFALDPQIYFISRLPVTWSPTLWITLIGAALVICSISSFVAARVALKHGSIKQLFR